MLCRCLTFDIQLDTLNRVILGCSVSNQVSPNVYFKDILNTKKIFIFLLVMTYLLADE